ncbi:MAG: hypothetical protein BA863_08705 [Desulfovibrio sp. S3730MH75]|nr:MAG: hypothetical protein BA863_08705 [Desulfovibrio sp. S3730MH75]
MTFFKFKNYCFFFTYLILSLAALFALTKGHYMYPLFGVVVIGGGTYQILRCNLLLKSVEEDRFTANFAYINKQFLFKDIREVKFLDMGKLNSLGDVDQFSIRTKNNKYHEVFYTVSSGDFEKIQEGVAKAQLQMGYSNTPK